MSENKCLFSYEKISGDENYTSVSLKKLNRGLTSLKLFPYTHKEQRMYAKKMAAKISIQGVQPKLSAILNVKESSFEVCQNGGRFILKPQVTDYSNLPENEDLTMKLAKVAGLNVPWHGLIRSVDGSLSYVIKRFDRIGRNKKVSVEDFGQLIGSTRTTKYLASMERLSEVLYEFCTYPQVEARKFFKQIIFSFVVGNEDLHVKNFSLISRGGKIELSPAYDLINSTLVLAGNVEEEMALEIGGKKKGFTRSDFESYASEHLHLLSGVVQSDIDNMLALENHWVALIEKSFLSLVAKERYKEILISRLERLKRSV